MAYFVPLGPFYKGENEIFYCESYRSPKCILGLKTPSRDPKNISTSEVFELTSPPCFLRIQNLDLTSLPLQLEMIILHERNPNAFSNSVVKFTLFKVVMRLYILLICTCNIKKVKTLQWPNISQSFSNRRT